jgi:hypothetical protein
MAEYVCEQTNGVGVVSMQDADHAHGFGPVDSHLGIVYEHDLRRLDIQTPTSDS